MVVAPSQTARSWVDLRHIPSARSDGCFLSLGQGARWRRRDHEQAAPSRVRVSGPPGAYPGSFSQELSRLGYSSSRTAGHLQLMARLSRWLVDIGWDPGELTVAWAERFVEHRRASGRVHRCLTLRGMGPLLDHLREIGVVPEPEPSRRWVGASS
jgi:hypothetical protein